MSEYTCRDCGRELGFKHKIYTAIIYPAPVEFEYRCRPCYKVARRENTDPHKQFPNYQ